MTGKKVQVKFMCSMGTSIYSMGHLIITELELTQCHIALLLKS